MPNSIYSSIISILPSTSSKVLFESFRIIVKESGFCGIRSDQLIKNDSNSSGSNPDSTLAPK